MKRENLFLTIIISTVFGIYAAAPVTAQILDDRGTPRIKIGGGSKKKNKPPVKPARKSAVKVPGRKREPPRSGGTRVFVPKTGDLVIAGENNAEITLQSSVKGVKAGIKAISGEGTAKWENLTPGKYTVTATLDGFLPEEYEIEIVADEIFPLNISLTPVNYDLLVESSVSDGTVRYAPLALGKSSDGTSRIGETGGYCVVPVKNGRALIKDLKKGSYNFDVNGDIEFEKKEFTINFPNDGEDDIAGDKLSNDETVSAEQPRQILSVKLERKISTTTFGTTWANSEWNVPAGWKIQDSTLGMKTGGFFGVALPKNEAYRNYTDFEMISDVRLLDGGTGGFVARAIDSQNYYLIQISGANAAEPYRLQPFIIKRGKAEPFTSISIQTFAASLAKGFRIIVRGRKNTFTVLIEDQEDGETKPMGEFTDPQSNFNKGAVGIAGQQNSNLQVFHFNVCAPLCQK